jgi:hypothetical protein
MFCVMRILKLANGKPSDCDGQFIKSFDADKHNGRGELITTKGQARASRTVGGWIALDVNAGSLPAV